MEETWIFLGRGNRISSYGCSRCVTELGILKNGEKWKRRLWGGIREGTAKIKEHFMHHMEALYSGSFLKYAHIWRWGERSSSGHFLLSNETSSPGNGLHLIEMFAKGIHMNPTNHQVTKGMVTLHKVTTRPHCLRQQSKNSLNMKKWSWYLPRAFTLMN